MKNVKNIVIVGTLVILVAAVLALKQNRKPASPEKGAGPVAALSGKTEQTQNKLFPRLVDLGAGKCIPCKMMKPILDDLKATCGETFKTEFVDVWENPDAGKQYGINLIPTQIFYGADGKELYRHEGFFSKEDILAKWKELGVEVAEKDAQRLTPNAQR